MEGTKIYRASFTQTTSYMVIQRVNFIKICLTTFNNQYMTNPHLISRKYTHEATLGQTQTRLMPLQPRRGCQCLAPVICRWDALWVGQPRICCAGGFRLQHEERGDVCWHQSQLATRSLQDASHHGAAAASLGLPEASHHRTMQGINTRVFAV